MSGAYDAIVVPGARVHADGRPSPAFARRLQRAVERYQAGLAPVVLVSGAGPGPEPEGRVGTRFAAELGVPEEALLAELFAGSTAENARLCAELVAGRVWVVTCDFHVWRCRRLFAPHFAEVHVEGVAGSQWLRPRLREAVSIAKYVVRG